MIVPRPNDNFLVIVGSVAVVVVPFFAAMLLLSTPQKQILIPFYASLVCAFALFAPPILRTRVSGELRARLINIAILFGTGIEISVCLGAKALEPITACAVFAGLLILSLIYVYKLDPIVYGFISRQTRGQVKN